MRASTCSVVVELGERCVRVKIDLSGRPLYIWWQSEVQHLFGKHADRIIWMSEWVSERAGGQTAIWGEVSSRSKLQKWGQLVNNDHTHTHQNMKQYDETWLSVIGSCYINWSPIIDVSADSTRVSLPRWGLASWLIDLRTYHVWCSSFDGRKNESTEDPAASSCSRYGTWPFTRIRWFLNNIIPASILLSCK